MGLLIGLLVIAAQVAVSVCAVTPLDDIRGMRDNYYDWSGEQSLGDRNRDGIGNAPTNYVVQNRLTFSESVSYLLYSHVLPMGDSDDAELMLRFRNAWDWAKQNMQRGNVSQVFSWTNQAWTNMPPQLSDHLLCWRYVRGINGIADSNGIVWAVENDENNQWHDGTQVATDGDVLVAYSLLLAANRGWGDDLRTDALHILDDIREKCVVDFKAGEVVNTQNGKGRDRLYWGSYSNQPDTNSAPDVGTIETLTSSNGVYGFKGKHCYSGWFNPKMDFSELDEIQVDVRGNLGANANIKLILEDDSGSEDGSEPGHLLRAPFLDGLTDEWQTFSVSNNEFVVNEHYGNTNGSFNWDEVKNIQFQMQADERIVRYSGSYDYFDEYNQITNYGSFAFVESPQGWLSWTGKQCFVGYEYENPILLTNASFRIIAHGSGESLLRVEDTNSIICTISNFNVTAETSTNWITVDESVLGQHPNVNFNQIKKIQIQSDDPIEMHFQEMRVSRPSVPVLIMDDGTVGESTLYIRSIRAKLQSQTGQTDQNDGLKLISNAHGALYMNPSYFMPFAFKLFAAENPENETFWQDLSDSCYTELDAIQTLPLLDMNGQAVTNNGYLIPNWYQFNRLTGQRETIETQEPESNVRGYKHGYDAFRTLFWLALDAYMAQDPNAEQALARMSSFYASEISTNDTYFPEYRIDGTVESDDRADAGFPAVYLHVLQNTETNAIAKTRTSLTNLLRRASDGRVWFHSSDTNYPGNGATEYFMNLWGLFGSHLDAVKNNPQLEIEHDRIVNDLDRDLLGDRWERIHFGTTTNSLPDADDDHDGASNLFEFLHGLNPQLNDTAGPLAITPQTNTLSFNVQTVTNIRYRIEKSTNLLTGVWEECKTIDGNGQRKEFTLPNEGAAAYYRLISSEK